MSEAEVIDPEFTMSELKRHATNAEANHGLKEAAKVMRDAAKLIKKLSNGSK